MNEKSQGNSGQESGLVLEQNYILKYMKNNPTSSNKE